MIDFYDKLKYPPREAEIATYNCVCDHCGTKLDRFKNIWVWNEHFGCSRDHVQRAQASTNNNETDADLL